MVGKGENVGYQHFPLFPQCFCKGFFPDTSKGVIVWEWVKKTMFGKGENVCNQRFCLFQHFFLFHEIQCFQKPSSRGSLKVSIVLQRIDKHSNQNYKEIATNT